MKLFLTGATGYIGGSVAQRLLADGHSIRGLARSENKAQALRERGIEPVIGDLDDTTVLMQESRNAEGVIHAASADHAPSLTSMLDALEGSGKLFIHTSGSSVIGDDVRGNICSDTVFDEDTPLVVAEGKRARHALDNAVLQSSERDVRSVVICPSLVYGTGTGLSADSIQIPFLAANAKKHGVVQIVGLGVNRWSNVHIEDLADLYALAVRDAPGGAFYFAENGEASFLELGTAIADRLQLPGPIGVNADAVAAEWGTARAYFTFGSNSRVRGVRARRELRWTPRQISALDWIRGAMPA